MPRRINRVVLYICNTCQSVFNDGHAAKRHWTAQHHRTADGARRDGARRLRLRRV